MRHRSLIAATLVALAAAAAGAQKSDRFLENCQRQGRNDDPQACEIRNFTLPALKGLVVDGRENGGVTVHGWDNTQIQVVAMIQARAESEVEAEAIAKQVAVAANNGGIAATGPDRNRRNQSWSVSYEIWVPRNTDLALTASNGGIAVDGIDSRMELETVNGGLSLVDVGGDIRGRTVNGGVNAELSGDRWRGAGGLDVRTSNGGVTLSVPSNYSANLETGTVNGGLNIGFPVTVRGNIGKQFTTQLGSGGATIRATTTNGGVTVRRR